MAFEYIIHIASIVIIVLVSTILAMILLPHKTFFIDNEYLNTHNINIDFKSIKNDFYDYVNRKNTPPLPWRDWYDKSQISGDVQYFPIKFYNLFIRPNFDICKNICPNFVDEELIKSSKIKNLYLLKFSKQSRFKIKVDSRHLSQKYVKLLIPIDFFKNDLKTGIIVQNDIKLFNNNDMIIFDNSVPHAIYNNSEKNIDCVVLCADIIRDEQHPPIVNVCYNKQAIHNIREERFLLKEYC